MVTHYVTLQWSHMGYRRCHIGCTLVTEFTIIDHFQVPYMTLFVVHVWPMNVYVTLLVIPGLQSIPLLVDFPPIVLSCYVLFETFRGFRLFSTRVELILTLSLMNIYAKLPPL